MVELFEKEGFQPSLLDRLTDDKPNKKVASLQRRVLSLQEFKKNVMRDLEWLLNAGHLESRQDLSDYPQVKRSVLNFGMPDLSGMSASSVDDTTLEFVLRQAILNFEPRILPKSLKINVINRKEHDKYNVIVFEVQGELWSQPVPERLYLKTILDLKLGNVEVKLGD